MIDFEQFFESVKNVTTDKYNCGDNVFMYIYSGITEEDFFNHEEKLEKNQVLE